MMANLAELVLEQPAPTAGTPTGDGNWRIVTEALLPAHPLSLVGVARVGVDVVSADVWTDLSEWATGHKITDGASEFGEHPAPATLEVTLRSPARRFATWAPPGEERVGHRLRNGCPIRVGLLDPVADVWEPLFTGEIETAPEISAGVDAVTICHVTAVDTVSSRLSQVQQVAYELDAAVESPTLTTAIAELADINGWPYGIVTDIPFNDAGVEYRVLGRTALSGNLLEHLRRIGDSVGRQVSADRYGRLAVVRRRPQLVTYTNAYTPGTDPNEPPSIEIDTATDQVVADTCHPVPAEAAIVNAVEIKDVWQGGLFGGAVVGENAEAARQSSVVGSTVGRGLVSGSSYSILELGPVTALTLGGRWANAAAGPDARSRRRYGVRLRSIDLFPMQYGLFVAEQLVENIVDIYADDLWRIDGLGLDNRELDTIAAARVGSPVELTHEGATFTGHIGGIQITATPLRGRCKITAALSIHAYHLDRGTP